VTSLSCSKGKFLYSNPAEGFYSDPAMEHAERDNSEGYVGNFVGGSLIC
jgi:hypothetical protein